MGTTGHGLVYPESSDPPEGWTAIQNLAESVETALDANELDGGWIAIGGGIVTGTLRYRVYRGLVCVHVEGTATTVTATFLTLNPSNALPADARPSIQVRAGGYVGSGFPGTFSVDTAGIITAVQASGANRASVSSFFSYLPG